MRVYPEVRNRYLDEFQKKVIYACYIEQSGEVERISFVSI